MSIRAATPADVPALVAMGRRFLADSRYRAVLDENPEQMASTARGLVGSPDGLLAVADVDGALVGMIGAAVFVHPLTGQKTAQELFWWVEPSYRGTVGIRLLRHAERWARASGARALQMVAPSEWVARIYRRLGYDQIEVNFQRSL